MGVSLNGGTPKNTPKWSFLVGKPMVVGYHHFRKPPYIYPLKPWLALAAAPRNHPRHRRSLRWFHLPATLRCFLDQLNLEIDVKLVSMTRELCNIYVYIHSIMYIYIYITGRYYRRYSGFFSNRRFAFWAFLHQTVQIEEFMIDLPNSKCALMIVFWIFFLGKMC